MNKLLLNLAQPIHADLLMIPLICKFSHDSGVSEQEGMSRNGQAIFFFLDLAFWSLGVFLKAPLEPPGDMIEDNSEEREAE